MSTTAEAEAPVPGCELAEGTPVRIDAEAIEATTEAALRSLRRDLDAAACVPTEVVVGVDFGADCSLTTQAEADRVRDYLDAADYLGAGTVRLDVEAVADPAKVRPAVDALRERAEREGLRLAVDADDL